MEESQDKTIIRPPKRGPGDSGEGNALPNGYILEGRYIIESRLGSGGFGITYLAKHRYLENIWVAIKEYMPVDAALRDSDSRVHAISEKYSDIYLWGLNRFLDEARLLHQYKHPNIVSVSDYFEANNTAYLVMDYVRGRSIQAYLDEGLEFDENQLRRIVYPLLDALKLIHHDGLYHRDISPDNILLREEDNSPVLIDFGSARYELRTHGVEQANSDQAHTPTAIFKHGYSPIEQYEGTTQGPYTDIYALGATLYKAAFGIRPVEVLKRSGEIRETKIDPLVSAYELDKGRFSDKCLRAIDAALQLEVSDRPQTTDAWLDIFGPPEKQDEVQQPESSAQPGWRKALAVGILILTVGVGGYLWYDTRQEEKIIPADVSDLLARVTAEIEKAPFEEDTLDKARHIYLQILTLDRDNTQALAGYNAANLLKQFNNALVAENQRNAVVLLGKVKDEFGLAGINHQALTPGWQRIELLKKLLLIRKAIPMAPLSLENWSEVESLIKDIGALPDGSSFAESGNWGLQALKLVKEFISKKQFTKAREHLEIAEKRLSPLGIGSLNAAKKEIDETEAIFEAERLAKITSLLQTAEQQMQQTSLTVEGLYRAFSTYEEILKLDDGQPKALAGYAVLENLINAFTAINGSDFGKARQSLDSAQKIAIKAGMASTLVDQAKDHLAKTQHLWAITQKRAEIDQLLAESIEHLSENPLDEHAIAQADALYQKVSTISAEEDKLEAEQNVAVSGIELVAALSQIRTSLESDAFEQARNALHAPEILALLEKAGPGPPLLIQADKRITEAEIDWNGLQAAELLQNRDLLQEANLDSVQSHLDRILVLNPEMVQASALSDTIAALRSVLSARESNNYAEAVSFLQQAQTSLRMGDINEEILASASKLILQEKDQWDLQQRQKKISAALVSAQSLLRDQEFTFETLSQAKLVFLDVLEQQNDQEESLVGVALVLTLESFLQVLNENDLDKAESLLAGAGAQVQEARFDPELLNRAKALLSIARDNWRIEITGQRITVLLNKAAALINEETLDEQRLNSAEDAYHEAVELNKELTGNKFHTELIISGLETVSLLKAFKAELISEQFEAIKGTVKELRNRLTAAKLDQSIADRLSEMATEEEIAWRIDQARDYMLSGVWGQDQNFVPAEDQYEIIQRIRPDLMVVESSLLGIDSLKQLFKTRGQRDYEQSLAFLAQAISYFEDSDIPKETFAELSQQLNEEQQRWLQLTLERNIISWTGAAIGEMSRTPFTEQAWERTESLAAKILGARGNDKRGLAVKQALDFIRQANKAIDNNQFEEAREFVGQASVELEAIGLWQPLRSALDIIDSKANTFFSSQIISASTSISQKPVTDQNLHEAKSALEKIQEADSNNPVAQTSIAVIAIIIEARVAASTTRFNVAGDLLNQAGNNLGSAPEALLPVLRDLLSRTRQDIAHQRPSPGEIYPIISIALRTITDTPLDEDKLDAAEKHLRNVLGLQADEPTALVGLQAIEQLRATMVALSEGDVGDARAALQKAQQQLVKIGLDPTTLQSAWRAVNEAMAGERTQ